VHRSLHELSAAPSPASRESIDAGGAAGALGKHEELGTIGESGALLGAAQRCTCGPAHLRLRSEHGELVKPRGGSVNRCDYCAKLAAVENCEMLVLDALDGAAPQLLMILTTRTATLSMESFRDARRAVVRRLRRRWPGFEYAYQVEYTTGYGPKAGGARRPHWNWFVKGVPVGDVAEFERLAVEMWCRYVDAEPVGQYVAEIRSAVGLTKYVTEHFMKASQRPPEGFSGQRFCASRRYFGESVTVATARARAHDSLGLGRELWKAAQRLDDAHEIELQAQLAHRRNVATRWVLASETGGRLGREPLPALSLPARLRALYADEMTVCPQPVTECPLP